MPAKPLALTAWFLFLVTLAPTVMAQNRAAKFLPKAGVKKISPSTVNGLNMRQSPVQSSKHTANTSLLSGKGGAAASVGSRLTIGPDVKIGSPLVTYQAPEISQEDKLMCWQDDNDNVVWVCRLDPHTGDMIPSDGRGTRVGVGAPFVGDWIKLLLLGQGEHGVLNGPEFGNSQEGLGVYFTIKDRAGVYQQAKALAPGFQMEQITFGGTVDRHGNLPSDDVNDPQARIGYYQSNRTSNDQTTPEPCFWQLDDQSSPQYQIPLEAYSYNGPRWIPNSHRIATYVTAPDGTFQVASYDVDTQDLEILTTGPQNHIDAVVMNDPDTLELTYMVCMEDNQAVAVYKFDGASWIKTQVIYPPDLTVADAPNYRLTGPRPFLIRGEMFFTYYVINGFQPINVYVASADGSVNQTLIAGRFPRYQINPKVLVSDQDNKFFVYYYTTLPIHPVFRLGTFHRVAVTVD